MAVFCRKIEIEYGLKQVVSPKRFLPQQEQQLPRSDMRKENLKATISSCIKQSSGIDDLAENLRVAGIAMEVGRGVLLSTTS